MLNAAGTDALGDRGAEHVQLNQAAPLPGAFTHEKQEYLSAQKPEHRCLQQLHSAIKNRKHPCSNSCVLPKSEARSHPLGDSTWRRGSWEVESPRVGLLL